ncbi:FxLYD domain-containing protein [Natrarchaeobaculum aegyptiacum]|uniref:DUF3426 domain-containing protein n=1 Tax=Natrarchaeobaculum aegyptiacum TaxID=745377 RepID=A0A2Z2HSH2_9EURY|nr:FxLYD domain-containing protein [Natrarchaeobaculum aegyptiacum]ARS90146.1 hypothetical protein B1756_10665 [Natrarchaeobaculum aegyptiacum]
MTRQRTPSGASRTSRPRANRRRVLAGLGSGVAVALAGCTDVLGDDAPAYEDGTVDVDGGPRSPDETVAAEALAETEINESVTPIGDLELEDHDFVLEDDYRGSIVQGTVRNDGGDRIQLAEVRARVYGDGDQLGRYVDTVGDLEPETGWAFEVVVLESPAEIDAYDVAVLGTPS